MTSNQVFENCQLEKSHRKNNHIVTTEYIVLAKNQYSILISHYFDTKLLGKYSQTPVWQLCDSCQILDLINFQNNLTWPNYNTSGISLDSTRLKYSKITHKYAKDSPLTLFLYWKLPIDTDFIHFICQFHQSVECKCQRVFWWASCTSARHAGSFDCLMASLILITMDNGRGHGACWQSCKVPNPQRNRKNGKCML